MIPPDGSTLPTGGEQRRGGFHLTTYLIANHSPVGAFLASVFVAGLDALQLQVQRVPSIELSSTLIGIIPYVAVLVVLAFKTRMPDAAGEHDESED